MSITTTEGCPLALRDGLIRFHQVLYGDEVLGVLVRRYAAQQAGSPPYEAYPHPPPPESLSIGAYDTKHKACTALLEYATRPERMRAQPL